jgi:hypothetical protein
VGCALALTAGALARQAPPATSVAWCRLSADDISGRARFGQVLLPAALAGASAADLIDDRSAAIVAEQLAKEMREGEPESALTACILRIVGDEGHVRPRCVLSVETAEAARFAGAVEASLDRIDPALSRRTVPLAAGAVATAVRADRWPADRELCWCALPGEFALAFDAESLREWITGRKSATLIVSPWQTHRQTVAPEGGQGASAVFELYLDLNAVRRGMDSTGAFEDDGRGSRLLRLFHLANARSFMLRARLTERADSGPRLLHLQATWSSRSEPIGNVRAMQLTESAWPGSQLRLPPPAAGDSSAAVWRSDVSEWLEMGLALYPLLVSRPRADDFGRQLAQWRRRHGQDARSLAASVGSCVVLTDDLGSKEAAGIAVLAELKPGASGRRFLEELSGVLTPFEGRIRADQRSRIWRLSLDDEPTGAAIIWGAARCRGRDIIIGAIATSADPELITTLRDRIEQPR